jgi:hypothetical protein
VIDACPTAPGNEAVAPALGKPRAEKWVVGQPGDLVAELPPALECVDDVCVERLRAGVGLGPEARTDRRNTPR